MPAACAVYGCTLRRSDRTRVLGIKFYAFPTDNKDKKRQWIAAISRNNWMPTIVVNDLWTALCVWKTIK